MFDFDNKFSKFLGSWVHDKSIFSSTTTIHVYDYEFCKKLYERIEGVENNES